MKVLRTALMITALAALPVSAQEASAGIAGFTNHSELSAPPKFQDNGMRQCHTLCTTAIGMFLGAGIGAGATYLYNTNKSPSERSIADGPAVALMAIIGGVVGGVAGFAYGHSH